MSENENKTTKYNWQGKPIFQYMYTDEELDIVSDVVFVVAEYASNGNLYVGLEDAHTGEVFSDVTRNLERIEDDTVSRIKNVDECEGMARFLTKNGMGSLVDDRYEERYPNPGQIDYFKGFIPGGNVEERYPLFSFCPKKLKEVDPEGYKNFLKNNIKTKKT